MTHLVGTVSSGKHIAGDNLQKVLALIEARSGIAPLIPNTLNVTLPQPYFVIPDFVVTLDEYNGVEELRFKHCRFLGIPCLIMRPDSHELGLGHGPAHLELMSTRWLRKQLGLQDRDAVTVEVAD